MRINNTDIDQPLFSSYDDEEKGEIKIIIAATPALHSLRILSTLLSDLEFKNPQWPPNFFASGLELGLVQNIISFLPGESIITFGFSCRALYNLSSQYLKEDLKKLESYQFERPLFASDEVFQCAEDIKTTKITPTIKRLQEQNKTLEKRCIEITACLGTLSMMGIIGTGGVLFVDLIHGNAKQDSGIWGSMLGFFGLCTLSCIGLCIAGCRARRNDLLAHKIDSMFAGLMTNLKTWQNKNNVADDKRKLLHDRSSSL